MRQCGSLLHPKKQIKYSDGVHIFVHTSGSFAMFKVPKVILSSMLNRLEDAESDVLATVYREAQICLLNFKFCLSFSKSDTEYLVRAYLNKVPRNKVFDLSIYIACKRLYLFTGHYLGTLRVVKSALDLIRRTECIHGLEQVIVVGRGKIGSSIFSNVAGYTHTILESSLNFSKRQYIQNSIIVLATSSSRNLLSRVDLDHCKIISVGNKQGLDNSELDPTHFKSITTDHERKYQSFCSKFQVEGKPRYDEGNELYCFFQKESSLISMANHLVKKASL
jgi:hypothetical protein